MAKKKKPAANPARGFATTSVASKPKPEKTVEVPAKLSPKEVQTPRDDAPHAPIAGSHPTTEIVTQSPEDLEAQLEHDELQLLVEKHASKTRRELRRQVAKYQVDRRVLRSQAQSMTVHDWISENVTHAIMALAQAESNDSNRKQGQLSFAKILSEEDATSKLWILDLTLQEFGFSYEHIEPVLKWVCANAATIDPTSSVWGFQEALEWLALNHCEGHSFSYDAPKAKVAALETPESSRPGTPGPYASADEQSGDKTLNQGTSSTLTSTFPSKETEKIDVPVSDLDSDLEPDQLIPTYLKIKGKLFEIDPDAVDARQRKLPKSRKVRNTQSAALKSSAIVQKLQTQLQQLESDALFDHDEADAQWPAKRNQIAQAQAAEHRPQDEKRGTSSVHPDHVDALSATSTRSQTPESQPEALGQLSDEDDEIMLGDMFTALPDEPSATSATDDSSKTVTLRDFGKQNGLSPRRLLEESIRARDPGARLAYKLVSPTTYSCRHALILTLSKSQEIDYDMDISGVDITTQSLQVVFTATTIATINVEQSEGFVSTAALFCIFASSTKEDKLYLRLPSNWRDLYRDLLEKRKARIDAEDRDSIKRLRTLIHDQLDAEESDGVVLTNRFKKRNQAATSSSASNSGRNTPLLVNESLKDLWEQKASTESYQRMLMGRANLPVFGFRSSILSTIDQNQVTIICGETGCGKSTQIPAYILEYELSQGKPCKIYCTEPRRISAISLAQRVSEELGEGRHDLGSLRSMVGYAIRLETKASSQTKLIYATVGVVLRMLESSGRLGEVTHLVIDEVHERSIDTDFLLIILRSLMLLRPELKVVLMSATVDAARFSKYLNNAPILNVPGRTYPVQTRYLEDAIEMTNYATLTSNDAIPDDGATSEDEETTLKERSGIPKTLPGYSPATRNALLTYDEYSIDYDLIVRLIEYVAFDPHFSNFSRAFLIFLPGIAEIRQLNDILLGHPSFDKSWLIYPLHSTISSEDQQAAFHLPAPGVRKVVLSTNIAETGVTIPDITCVVDTGKHKEMRFDERRQLSRLTQSFISRANAKQRRGRAGRVQEGLCFHLFTKYRHDSLLMDQQTPEMLRLSLQDLVMRTKICKLGDIEKTLSEALDPPSSRNIRRAIDALIEVDALTPSEDLTSLGRQIAKLPLDAHLGKLVLLSTIFGCVDAAITIAATLSSKSPFLTPFGAKQRADAARLAFRKGDSDLLTAYNAYKSWKTVCTTPGRSELQFCHKNFLSPQNLGNIEDLKAQLLSSLVDAGFVQLAPDERRALSRYRSTTRHRTFVDVPSRYDAHSDNDVLVNSVLATALYPKILLREGKGWRNISNNQTVSLSPTSVNKSSPTVRYLSYYSIMQTTNKYYNAHSTSIAYPLPMVLMVGAADVTFQLHSGVISLPGNSIRFSVKEWTSTVALKVLRRRMKEILSMNWKNPGRQMSGRETEWLGLFFKIFAERHEKEEKIRERAGGRGK